MVQFNQEFIPLRIEDIHEHAAIRKVEGWRYVQMLAVNTDDGIDLIYSFMKDGELENNVVSGIKPENEIPSVSDLFLEAFVFENETHDLFGVNITDIAIDFGGNFYTLAVKEPMTVISPEQLAAREKAQKIAAAKAAKEAKQADNSAEKTTSANGKSQADLEDKLSGMDPEKAAKGRAAMEKKARRTNGEDGDAPSDNSSVEKDGE